MLAVLELMITEKHDQGWLIHQQVGPDPESCPFGTRAPSLHITLHHRLQHHYAVHYISI